MLIKLDEAIAAILAAGYEGSQGEAVVEISDAVQALRALPVSDGWEDIATAPRQVWLLCWGPDAGSGVAKYPFNIIGDEWPDYTHWRPLPAPPTIE